MGNLLIGSCSARFDKSGRIKIPEKFRTVIEEHYGKEVFITSLTDKAIQIYPIPVWEKLTGITGEGLLHLKPELSMFLLHVNRRGTRYELDSKGRILISQSLRERAKLEDEIEILGLNNHLELWNKEILDDFLNQNPLTDENFELISNLYSRGKIG